MYKNGKERFDNEKRFFSIALVLIMLAGMMLFGAISVSALNWEGVMGKDLNTLSNFGDHDAMYIILDNGDSTGGWSNIGKTLTIQAGVTVTIDMNGKILKSNVDGPLFDVYGTLILKNAGGE